MREIQYGKLDSYIEEEFLKTHIPGMSVEVVSRDEVLFAKTYGDCDSLDSPFIVGSVSKSFTAAAIMQLAEQGKLELSRPMADYLPDVDRECKTTIKQLLNQTSGIKTYDVMENYTAADGGMQYQYANVNYGLLGLIIEQVSGLDYGSYIKKNIFEPLGMTHSFVSLEEAKRDGLTEGHRNYFGIMVASDVEYPYSTSEGWMTGPSAYIISTANDMGKYLQAYLKDGENLILPDSRNTMFYDTVKVGETYCYGMGWGNDTSKSEPILMHGGNVENYTTNMFLLPEREIGVIVMYDACDYLVANKLAGQLSHNILYKLMGEETKEIQALTYTKSHLMINSVSFVLLFASILPLLGIKAWKKKYQKTGKTGMPALLGVHLILPTLIQLIPHALKTPDFVIRRLVPDIFLLKNICSGVLYLTGIFKVIYAYVIKRR